MVNKYLIPATCQVVSFTEIKLPQPRLWQKAFFEKIRSRGTHITFLQRTAGFMKLYTNFYLTCFSHLSEVIGWPRLKHPTIRTIPLNSCLAQCIEHSRKPIPVSFFEVAVRNLACFYTAFLKVFILLRMIIYKFINIELKE